MLAFTA